MQLLYGTGNPAKIKHMKEMLHGIEVEIIGLKDTGIQFDEIDESGNHPLENAKIKALAYYRKAGLPVFSCDSGLYIEGLEQDRQPGVHVRRVHGKVLNDEEMIAYYTSIAAEFGGTVKARYRNAICLVMDEEHTYEYDGDDIATSYFLLAAQVHPNRDPGFPLDSISLELQSGAYYMDIKDSNSVFDNGMSQAFKQFFRKTALNEQEIYEKSPLPEI
ncbi:MAG: hypothetical protein K0R57_2382 [Paenibacillaceae bacterium]|jgi:8-oxo-dGTP diphosphatase|nr:hypothetical protein [Paenibacillaceae bacterium]